MLNNLKKKLYQQIPFFMMVPALVWQVLFFFIPLLLVVSMSFMSDADGAWFSRMSLQHYMSLSGSSSIYIFMRSALLALFTASSCLIAAYPIAYFLAFIAHDWKNLLLFFLLLPFWTNFLVQVYAWFFLLENNGLINTVLINSGIISTPFVLLNNYFAICVIMFYCYLPFMVLPLYTVMEKIDYSLIEAARDLGAAPLKTVRTVLIPLSRSGIVTGFFLVFVPAFGEFIIPQLVGGNKQMYVGGLISHYFLVAGAPSAGAAVTVMSSIVLILLTAGMSWGLSCLIGSREVR